MQFLSTRIAIFLLFFLFFFVNIDKVRSQSTFYSINEFYVYSKLGYNFYGGVDFNLGTNFRIPLTESLYLPLQVEFGVFGERLNVLGEKIPVSGLGGSLNTYYGFVDIGQITGIIPLEYIGVVGGFSTFYESASLDPSLGISEVGKSTTNLSYGLNIGPIAKIKFSDYFAGVIQYTLYILPNSPFGVMRESLSLGIQYNVGNDK